MKGIITNYKKLILQELTTRKATKENPCTLDALTGAIEAALKPPQEHIDKPMFKYALTQLHNEDKVLVELCIPNYRGKASYIVAECHLPFCPGPFSYEISLRIK
jgi:hypothetical protein